ncbi:leucine-rich repeat-containing protein 43-like isoform X5 [Crassostrea angulata]|uniref:leucine-rich repeat-containing protein 43-like isoform X5 n=1 Tax=Magallana angulata TaxID=2784310 RepID=UPI0022B110A8|nr:leucine-rich repeat-containing protein 43-like isoform X5 [Crassostrea angulata]
MTAVSTERAYSAFEKQLRTLCLREFPCGTGSWRETKTKNLQLLKSKDNVDSRFSVTLKDFGADHEKTENLEEHVTSKYSPWHLDYSWSKEAKKLRELAVKSPWLIDDNFILSFFKTLRICDKNVTEVDENLLKFKALEELTLSANRIITVNSKNLPTSLKVLELCANQISDISALCVRPPPLIHLGLGSNKISFIGDYLTGDYWPNLLSLDLSHNNLSDLLDVIRKLGSLPKLRNLILQGNPLSLIPGYRGYTIDSLRKLSILDDIMISADEKHHYKGLARRREYILDEAKVSLEVTYIKGVPMPDELKNPEEQPEFPKIERKYFVQFMFPQDVSQKAEIFQICDDDFNGLSPLPVSEGSQFTPQPTSPILEEGELRVYSQQSQNTEAVKNVNFTAQPEVVSAREPTAEYERPPDEIPLSVTPKQSEEAEQDETMEAKTEIQLEAIKSEGGIWAEEIELNWSQVAVRDELLTLRNFLKQGMDFSVVEEMTNLMPLSPENSEVGSRQHSPVDKKGGKDDKKDDKKGGKKKKEPEVELKRMPPTYTTLAMWHIPLVDFLEGEYEFRSVFTQGGVEVASTIKSLDIGKKDKDKKKPGSSKPKKDEKGGKDSRRSSVIGKMKAGSARSRSGGKTPSSVSSHGGRKMSAAGQKKDDKKGDKGKGGKAAAPAPEEEEDQGPPPPLEVQVAVRLHHWKTAMDSLKEEEEKNKAMAEEQQQG